MFPKTLGLMETLKKQDKKQTVEATMRITGAEAIIHCLLAEGVDLIYGYPGGAIMPVYDELYKFQDKLTHILTRHEQGATHAAQGYARVSGRVGVAMATSGPGATNLVTGLADAQIDSTPMVCITGQVPRHLLGSDAFQETDMSILLKMHSLMSLILSTQNVLVYAATTPCQKLITQPLKQPLN